MIYFENDSMTDLVMERSASISPCEKYRYSLRRRWDANKPKMVFIMLNPSTADAEKDDATIRVCMGRALRMGFGEIMVLNLFAYRATDPTDIRKADDPVGPMNDCYLMSRMGVQSRGDLNIAAWGNDGIFMDREREVLSIMARMEIPLYTLGLTKAGHPRHPLRIPYSIQPQPWKGPEQ